MIDRAHGLGRDRGQIGLAGTRLVQVHLLETEDVGIQFGDRGAELAQVDAALVDTTSVQDVESGHPHGYLIPIWTDQTR